MLQNTLQLVVRSGIGLRNFVGGPTQMRAFLMT